MTKFDRVTGPERDEEVIAIEVLASLSETNSLAASQAHMLVPKLEQTGQRHAELMGDMNPRQYDLPQQLGSHGPPRYRGVVYNKVNGLWMAGIAAPGRSIRLGAFSTAEAAARMYDNAALRIRGANASLNFPRCDYVLPSGALALDLQVEALLLEELLGRAASSSQNGAAAVLGGLVEETGNEDHISDLVRQCLGRINQADSADLQEAAEALGPDYNRLLSLIRDAGQLLAAQSGRSAGSEGGVSGRGGSSAFGGYGAATRSEGAVAAGPNGGGAAEYDSRYAGSDNVEDRVVGDGGGRRGYSNREASIGGVAARSEVLRPSGRNQHGDTGRGSAEGTGVQDEAARPAAGALRAEVPSSASKAPVAFSRGGQQEDQAARPQMPSAAPWQPPPRQHVPLEAAPTAAAGGTWPGDVAAHAAEGGKADKVDGASLGRGGGKDAGGGGRAEGDIVMEDVGRVGTAAPVIDVESAPATRGPLAPQSVPPPASLPASLAAATARAAGMDTVPFIPPIVTAPHMPPNFMHNVCHLLMTHIQQAAKARASQPPGSLPPPVVVAVRELEQNGLPLAQLLAAAAHLAACNLLPPEDYQAMQTALWSAPQAHLAAAAFFNAGHNAATAGIRGRSGSAAGNARESVSGAVASVPHAMDRDRGAPNDSGAGGDGATRGKLKAQEEPGGDTPAVTDAADEGVAHEDDPPVAKRRAVEGGRQPEVGLQAAGPMARGGVAANYSATMPTGAAGYDTSTSVLIAAATAAASAAAGLPPGIPMDAQEQARVAAATAAAIAAITGPVLSPLSRGPLLPTRTGPGTASGSSMRQQLGLGRRLFSAISSQLPPGAELHCLLPPCDGYLGVLYTHGPGSHQVGAALWDGGSITNLGAYSSERDARQCIAANAGVRQQFANRTMSMITTSPGRTLRGGGSAGAPLAPPPLAPSGSVLTDMSGNGGSIIAAAAAAAARDVFMARGTSGAAAPAPHNNSTGLYKSAAPRCGNGGGGSSVTGSMPRGPVMPGSVAPARPAAPSQPSQVSYGPSGSNCSPACTEQAATACGNGGMARDVTSGGAGVASGDGASGELAHTRPGPMGPAQALVGMKRPSPLSATAPTGGVAAAVVGRREPPLPYNRSRSSVAASGAAGAASPGSGAAAPELEAVGSSIPRPVLLPQLVGPPTTGPNGSLELVCRLQVPGREALSPDALKRLVEMSFSTETLLRFISDVAAVSQPAVAPNHDPSVRHTHPAAAPTSPPVNPPNLPVQPEQIHRWPSDRYPRGPAAGPAPGAAAAGATAASGAPPGPPPMPFATESISAFSGGIAEPRGLLAEAPSVRAPLRQPQPAQQAYGSGGPPSQQQPQQNVTAPFAAYQRDRKREWEWERERAGGQNDRQGAPPGSVRQEPGPLQHERTVVWPERTPPLSQAHSLVSQLSLAMHHSLPPQNSTSAGALMSQRPPSHAPAITTGSGGEPTGRKGPLLATAGTRDGSTAATPPPAARGVASGPQPASARTSGGRPGTAPTAAEIADASAMLTMAAAAEDATGSAVRRHPGSAVVHAMVTSEGPADPRRRFVDGGAGGGDGSGGGGPAGPVRATTEARGEVSGGERALLAANDREVAGEEAGGAGAQELMRLAAAAVEATMDEQCGSEGGVEEAVYAGRRTGGVEAAATHDGHGVAAKDRMATQQDSLTPNQAQHEHVKAKQ